MKKFIAILLSLVLALALTACGSEPAAEEATAEEATAEEVPAEEATGEVTLDYDTIASWVSGGYIGVSAAGEGVLLVFDENMTMAGIIFGDPESGNAVSFFGDFVDNADGTVTINDETNGLSLTFGVEQISDTVMNLDMGEELGTAQVEAATLEDVLSTLQSAIENFNHVA